MNKDKCSRGRKNGFTLVELLAVIVILAIILVIAVPKVMSVIDDARKATLESTAKMIASSAEKKKMENKVLGNNAAITCESVTKINNLDYESCIIKFEVDDAKVTIVGKGKFSGLNVCSGTKTNATATNKSCIPLAVSFKKDDWATIVAAVQSGNYPYQVDDKKEIYLGEELGTHTIRVANTTPCSAVSVISQTACGFVLEFADIIKNDKMNTTGIYIGGWPESKMREYINETIYNAIPEDLRNGIIDTYVVSAYGMGDAGTLDDGNFESTDKLYLLSPEEVYVSSFASDYDKSIGTSRQLDWYEDKNVTESDCDDAVKLSGTSASGWWLRSPISALSPYYFTLTGSGGSGYVIANGTSGISPAFRLAE